MIVVGMISGTSVDGVDVAAAELTLDGDELLLRRIGERMHPYPERRREAIHAALPPATTTMAAVCGLDTGIGQTFAEAAAAAVNDLCSGAADLVVSHGQTLYHWVENGRVLGTLQLGSPAWIAERTGLPVLSDLRSRDVTAGGQGAPLVSLVDAMLLAGSGKGVQAALNLGGIANITIVAPDSDPIAFDVGPGNALIDAAVRRVGRSALMDLGGAGAARGHVDPALAAVLRADPYYAAPAPKSTGKEHFNGAYLEAALLRAPVALPDDVLATVTAVAADTVADACLSYGARRVVAAGGGVRNATLMAGLTARLGATTLTTMDALGLPSDAREAYAFCVLGYLTWHGLPATLPSCTGARHASVLGSITPGRAPLRLPDPVARSPVRLSVVGPEVGP